jgi:hypothetical protein
MTEPDDRPISLSDLQNRLYNPKKSRLMDYIYQVFPQSEWPKAQGRRVWNFTSHQAQILEKYFPDNPTQAQAQLFPTKLRELDEDEMYELLWSMMEGGDQNHTLPHDVDPQALIEYLDSCELHTIKYRFVPSTESHPPMMQVWRP